MRIAVISSLWGHGWGGSEELWAEMVAAALKDGHSVSLFLDGWKPIHPRVLALQNMGLPISFRVVPGSLPRFSKLYRPLAWLTRPYRSLYAFRPDAVFISLGYTWSCTQFADTDLMEWLAEHRVPYISVSQLNDDAGPPSDFVSRRAAAFFERAAKATFVSDRNRRAVIRQLARDLPNSCVVRNPVNLTDRSIVAWPSAEKDDPAYFACVARLDCGHKGHDVLFEALSLEPWRGRNWRLRLYGQGPSENYLRNLATLYGIADRIEFCGQVSDIRAIWSVNHLLVLGSRGEGTALALVEALLCGRLAVATDVGGAAEWIQEGVNGFLADAPNANSISAALDRGWSVRPQWRQMGERAHEIAMSLADVAPGRTILRMLIEAHAQRSGAGDALVSLTPSA